VRKMSFLGSLFCVFFLIIEISMSIDQGTNNLATKHFNCLISAKNNNFIFKPQPLKSKDVLTSIMRIKVSKFVMCHIQKY